MWTFEYTKKFIKQCGTYDSIEDPTIKDVLTQLATSDDPTKLGKYKKLMGVYAYEFGRSIRMLYNVRRKDNVIELIRFGDHKETYGKG